MVAGTAGVPGARPVSSSPAACHPWQRSLEPAHAHSKQGKQSALGTTHNFDRVTIRAMVRLQ